MNIEFTEEEARDIRRLGTSMLNYLTSRDWRSLTDVDRRNISAIHMLMIKMGSGR